MSWGRVGSLFLLLPVGAAVVGRAFRCLSAAATSFEAFVIAMVLTEERIDYCVLAVRNVSIMRPTSHSTGCHAMTIAMGSGDSEIRFS